MKWNRFFERFYLLAFFGGKQLLVGLACWWCIIGITQCFHLFSCYNIITFSSEGLYFELPTATFLLIFFLVWKKETYHGNWSCVSLLWSIPSKHLAETPFGKTFISTFMHIQLGHLLIRKKCIWPSWLFVVFNKCITPMDIFKNECSNFLSDEGHNFSNPKLQDLLQLKKKMSDI